MLKTFLEIEQDAEALNKKRRLFEGGEYKISEFEFKQLNELKIAKFKNTILYKKYFGSYPVIFINFYGDINPKLKSNSESEINEPIYEIKKKYRNNVKNAYCLHDAAYRMELEEWCIRNELKFNPKGTIRELENLLSANKQILSDELDLFQKYRKGDNSVDLNTSISNLVKFLHDHYNKKVFIIIDEYDSQLTTLIGHPLFSEISDIYKSILSPMKDEPLIEKFVVAGILPLTLGNLFSSVNQTSLFTVKEHELSEHFGFTVQEVNNLLNKVSRNHDRVNKLQKSEISLWYNGYKFGETINYNPWSIVKCIQCYLKDGIQPVKDYWTNSSVLEAFKIVLFKLKNLEIIKDLIIKEKIFFPLEIKFNTILESVNDFVLLLLHAGYLTSCKELDYYRIPNKEVKKYFYDCYLPILIDKYFQKEKTLQSVINNFSDHLDDFERYKEDIENLLSDNKFVAKTESDFKEYFGGIHKLSRLYTDFAKHIQYSEQYTNYQTRLDHTFLPINGKSNIAIIHEYKQTLKEIEVNNLLEAGLWQIYSQLYMSNILSLMEINHIETILTRVIVCYICNKEWKVNMVQWSHSVREAIKINDFFMNFDDRAKLTREANTLATRRKFLARMNEDIEDLPALLNKFKEEEEELQKKEEKGEPIKKTKYNE